MLGTITTFPNRFARQGTRHSIRWERLFDRFEQAPFAAAKDHLPLWSPATFESDSRADGSAVREVFALVLDFDHGGRIEQALEVFGDHYGAIHSTFSHSAEEHRFRCVLPMECPVPANQYAAVWCAAEAMCHAAALFPDPSTKNASRIWFVPARRPATPFVVHRLGGAVVVPGDLVARWRRPTPSPSSGPTVARGPAPYEERERRLRRASAYLARMPASVSGQGGHNALWRAAIALVRGFKLEPDDAFLLLKSEFSPRCEPPWRDRELWHKCRQAVSAAHVPYGYLGGGHAA